MDNPLRDIYARGALPGLRHVVAVLAIACHAFAASLPCPPPPGDPAPRVQGAARGHASHAMHGHGGPRDAPGSEGAAELAWKATCFCGCGSAPIASSTSARTGPALLAAAPRAPHPALALPASVAALRAPDAPVLPVDPVPV